MKKFAYIVASLALATTFLTGCGSATPVRGAGALIEKINSSKEKKTEDEEADQKQEEKSDIMQLDYHSISTQEFERVLENNGFSCDEPTATIFQNLYDSKGYSTEVLNYYNNTDKIKTKFTLFNVDGEGAEEIFNLEKGKDDDYPINDGQNEDTGEFVNCYLVDNQVLCVRGPVKDKKKILSIVEELYTSKDTKVTDPDNELPEEEPIVTPEATQEVNNDNNATTEDDEYVYPTKQYYELKLGKDSFLYQPNPEWKYQESQPNRITGIIEEESVAFLYLGSDIPVTATVEQIKEQLTASNIDTSTLHEYELGGKKVYIVEDGTDELYGYAMLQDVGCENYLLIDMISETKYSEESVINCFGIEMD